MKYLLFGHSFVRRVTGRVHDTLRFPVDSGELRTECFGEGGLSFDRVCPAWDIMLVKIRSLCPDIIKVDFRDS